MKMNNNESFTCKYCGKETTKHYASTHWAFCCQCADKVLEKALEDKRKEAE